MMNRIFALTVAAVVFTGFAGIAQTEQDTAAAKHEAFVQAQCAKVSVSRATCQRLKGVKPRPRIEITAEMAESLGY